MIRELYPPIDALSNKELRESKKTYLPEDITYTNTQTYSVDKIAKNEKEAEVQLLRLNSLPPDWDSYGASSVDETCIFKVIEILKILFRYDIDCPWIVPINNGMIQLEWHFERGCLELEFISLDEVEVFYKAGEKAPATHRQVLTDMTVDMVISLIKTLS